MCCRIGPSNWATWVPSSGCAGRRRLAPTNWYPPREGSPAERGCTRLRAGDAASRVAGPSWSWGSVRGVPGGVLDVLAGLLDVRGGLVLLALGLQVAVVGGIADALLDLALGFLGLVADLVADSHGCLPSSWLPDFRVRAHRRPRSFSAGIGHVDVLISARIATLAGSATG